MSQYQTFFISASGNSSQCDEINHFLRSHVVIRTVENIINSGSNGRLFRIFSHILIIFLLVLNRTRRLQLFLLHHLWPCAGRFFCTEPQMDACALLKLFTEILWPWLSRMCRSDIGFCLKLFAIKNHILLDLYLF